MVDNCHVTVAFSNDQYNNGFRNVNITISYFDNDGQIDIGTGEGILISGYDPANHQDAIEQSDNDVQDTYELCKGFDPTCLSEYNITANLFLLNTVEITPTFRGKGYGKFAMKEIIKFFQEVVLGTVIIIKPHPIVRGNTKQTTTEINLGIKKLQSYWKQCGFKRCKNTQYFFRECDLL